MGASARLFKKELAILAKCTDKALDCVYAPTSEGREKCLAKKPCVSTVQDALQADKIQLDQTLHDACGGSTPLGAAAGLGFDDLLDECQGVDRDILVMNQDGIDLCLRKVYERAIERLFAVEAPRTRELFDTLGIELRSLPDLPGYPNCKGCGVSSDDPTVPKALKKCSKSIIDAGRAYAESATQLLSKCALALFACEQSTKPQTSGELDVCRAKAQLKCEQAKEKAQTGRQTVRSKINKDCAQPQQLTTALLTSQAGANLAALQCECNAVNVPNIDTLDNYLECSRLHHECRVAQLVKFAVPRLDGLLLNTAHTQHVGDILCPLPTPTPVPPTGAGLGQAPALVGGCQRPICRFLNAIRARLRKGLFGPIVKVKDAVLRPAGKSTIIRSVNARGALERAATSTTIRNVQGDRGYVPNTSREIHVQYDSNPAAAARAASPNLFIAVERRDGSLLSDDVFELELDSSLDEADLTVAFSAGAPGEDGCSFRIVFGTGDDNEIDLTDPYDLFNGSCHSDGDLQPGEDCDDGNSVDGDGCDSNCTTTRCGNGIVTAGEECDDGNLDDGDACSSTCTLNTTSTQTATPTVIPTKTPTPLITATPGSTGSSAVTSTPVAATVTSTRTVSPTPTPALTPTETATPTASRTITPIFTSTATPPATITVTSSRTPTPIPTGSPPHFVDNGDGTVTDNQTGLQWEKKTTTVGSPHNVDNTYTWSTGAPAFAQDGTAFTDFLVKLNTTPCFANHCDWRLPSEAGRNAPFSGAKELEDILLAPFQCGTNPCIDSTFGPTASGVYWSDTTTSANSSDAWDVGFTNGNVNNGAKGNQHYVRAVRP